MPELPEVEVVRRGLEPKVAGAIVQSLSVREPRLRWPVPTDLARRLRGARLRSVGRRGKYLLFDFGAGTLIVHLGMSGQLRLRAPGTRAERHDHVDIETSAGLLRFTDPRRFGAILWHDAAQGDVLAHPLLAHLGVEPLSSLFDGALLYRLSRGRSLTIKQMLLSGREVVGVGNIYASESLFRAGISPRARAGRLSRVRCDALAEAIRQTLRDAISRGGSSLRDFVDSDGAHGHFQLDCQVYGRAGEACRRCGAMIKIIRQQQRSSFYCPSCQRP
jgi:formamidopyrimidine-DNA glycosylase